MSGDHNQYQKGLAPPDYTDRRQWNYNPMTGEPLVDGWPLYSGLPQREWQGLTDEEIDQIAASFGYGYIDVARAIESKLKEKNNES
jgi:hypothetical protein